MLTSPLRKIIFLLIGLIGTILALMVVLVYFSAGGSHEKEAISKNKRSVKIEQPKFFAKGTSLRDPQKMTAGKVGETIIKGKETDKEKLPISPTMPPAVFSTTGRIIEKGKNYLLAAGEGTNFADMTPRQLKCFFTDQTLTFSQDRSTTYRGRDGLKYLQQDIRILISSDENIRGKTEFAVKTVNILP